MPFISRPNITFCSADSHGSSSANWNTMPRSWPQPRTSRPSTVTLPAEAVSSPMAIRSAVVLPQPEGPMSATISPSCTLKLTRLSACTVCCSPSMRSVNRFDMSCRVTSPMPHPVHIQSPLPSIASIADARQRFLADIGINQLVDVAAFGELAERDHLLLRPHQAVERNGEIGIDHAGLQALLVDEGRARVVGLGADRLARQRDGLVAMGHGITHRLDLRGHEPHQVPAALVDRLARHQRAEAQELRQYLA